MTPNNPMTEGEALAVDAACAAFARLDGIADWSDPSWQESHQIEAGRLRTRMRAAIAAALREQPEARVQGVSATQAAQELTARLTEDRAILDDIRDAMGDGPYDTLATRIRKMQPEARGVVEAVAWHVIHDDGGSHVMLAETVDDTFRAALAANGRRVRPLIYGDTRTAAQQPVQEGGGARLTNPWTGEPRDYRDVNSDPAGTLCVEPGAPLKAPPPSAPVGVAEALQRLIDNAATLGPASMEDALLVARHRSQALTQQPAQAAPGCTCPSGDGSLRWPCPTHPPAQAAPGYLTADEREWLDYAIEHMRDDSEPEDLTCADVLEALLQRAAPPGDDAAGGAK